MSAKQEALITVVGFALLWVLWAGMTGELERIDDQLVEAGINIWEIIK